MNFDDEKTGLPIIIKEIEKGGFKIKGDPEVRNTGN